MRRYLQTPWTHSHSSAFISTQTLFTDGLKRELFHCAADAQRIADWTLRYHPDFAARNENPARTTGANSSAPNIFFVFRSLGIQPIRARPFEAEIHVLVDLRKRQYRCCDVFEASHDQFPKITNAWTNDDAEFLLVAKTG
jgi:hypothetical protein